MKFDVTSGGGRSAGVMKGLGRPFIFESMGNGPIYSMLEPAYRDCGSEKSCRIPSQSRKYSLWGFDR